MAYNAPKSLVLPNGATVELSLSNPLFADFERMPATFEQFITDPYYLGKSWKDPFPAWRALGNQMFPLPLHSPYNALVLLGATGIGKALPNYQGVLTPAGYVPIGNIKVGDLVASNDGKFYPVTGVFPQGKQPVYEIEFNYGIKVRASDEHIWTISRDYGKTYHDETTAEIIEKGYKYINRTTGWAQHQVELPSVSALELPEKNLPLDPYLLGALLGDGSLGDAGKPSGGIGFSTADQFILDKLNSILKRDWDMELVHQAFYDYRVRFIGSRAGRNLFAKGKLTPLKQALINLKVDATSNKKHVPEEYLFAEFKQRKALLDALVDTDGTVNQNGVVEFTTVSEQLSKDVKFLAETLGLRVRVVYTHTNFYMCNGVKKPAQPVYFLTFYGDLVLGLLPRKVQKQINRNKLRKVARIHNIKYIEDEECTCISVAAPSKLFLTEHGIPTHNTSFATNMVASYFLHIILCLKNPHTYFDLEEQKNIVFAFLNIVTKSIAYKNAWGMFHRALLKSDFFMEYGYKTLGNKPEWVCDKKPVELLYGSTADHVIGLDIIFAFLDEISFSRNQDIQRQMEKAKEVFDAALERIQSRFTKFGGIFDGLIVMASSKRTDQAFAEVYAKELASGKGGRKVIVFDKPRWEVLPKGTYSGKVFPVAIGDKLRPSEIIKDEDVVTYRSSGYRVIYPPIETYDEFARDMTKALTNIAGESVNAAGTFIAGEYVAKCLSKTTQNPFLLSLIYCGTKDKEVYQQYFDMSKVSPEDLAKPLYIHLDASLGKDGNSISGGNIAYAQDQLNEATGMVQPELHFKQVFKVKIRAPKGDQTMLRKNEQFIFWLVQQGFRIAMVTSDQFQSVQFGQDLAAGGVPYRYQSIDKVQDGINQPYSVLRNAIYEGRIALLDDDDQTDELIHLIRYPDGRVDKPRGGQDDAAQTLCGWVYAASLNKEHFIHTHAVLEATMLGSSRAEQLFLETDIAPGAAINGAAFLTEFGAYRTEAQSGLRDSFDKLFPKKKGASDSSGGTPSPFNFF